MTLLAHLVEDVTTFPQGQECANDGGDEDHDECDDNIEPEVPQAPDTPSRHHQQRPCHNCDQKADEGCNPHSMPHGGYLVQLSLRVCRCLRRLHVARARDLRIVGRCLNTWPLVVSIAFNMTYKCLSCTNAEES